MSISTIQEKLFNKGCGSVIIVVAALAMGASLFSQCNGPAGLTQEQQQTAVAIVDGVPVSSSEIQSAVDSQAKMVQSQYGITLDVGQQAAVYAETTGQALRRAAIQALATKGPSITDSEIEKAAAPFIDDLLNKVRQNLKPGATDAEFEAEIKRQTGGKTSAEFRAAQIADFKSGFADPSRRSSVLSTLGGAILAARLGEKAVGTDQALRDSYKTFVVKRIFFSAQSGSSTTPEARATKALADLKAGTSFDKLMDTVSNDPRFSPAKPVHETTENVSGADLQRRPELATLVGKTPPATTGAVDVPGGMAIYRLVSVNDGVPADFEKNKAKYRSQKALEAGQSDLQRQVTEMISSKDVKWQSEGFRALAAVAEATAPTGSPEAVAKAFELATAVSKSVDASEKRLGAMAMLAASDAMGRASAAPSATKTANRLATLEAAQAAGLEDSALSLELADLYAQQKNGEKTALALTSASKFNVRYDKEGERVFREVAGKVLKLQTSKVITKEQADAVLAQQALWQTTRVENEKAAAEAKAQAEVERKSNEAEIARQKAEAAKMKAENDAEIARQKAEAAGSKAKPGSSPTPAAPKTTGGQ